MKEYVKPEVEMIALVAKESTTSDDVFDGDIGLGSSEFD
jgi:hypothetical protein